MKNGPLFHLTNTDNSGNVSGMLLYAKINEEVMHNQSNTFGKNVISFRTLDLTEDFELVAKQLDEIAYEFTGNAVRKKL